MRTRRLLWIAVLVLVATVAVFADPPGPPHRPGGPPRPSPGLPQGPPEFCSEPAHQLQIAPYPPHARNRLARVARDAGCSRRPGLRCTDSSPVPQRNEAPVACVDIEVLTGADLHPFTGDGAYPLMCVECPDGLLPTQGQALCDETSRLRGQQGKVYLNLSGQTLDEIDALWTHAMTARRQALERATPTQLATLPARRSYLNGERLYWETDLLEIVRKIAPQIGYCEEAPFGIPASRNGWAYAAVGHRADLNAGLEYHGEGVFGETTLATATAGGLSAGPGEGPSGLNIYLTAFYDPRDELAPMPRLNLESFVLALLHEMRHMGTPNRGMGPDPNLRVANAERWLNELQDYTRMFEHPYVIGMEPARLRTLRAEYGQGRNKMYGCFAHQWGTAGPSLFPGYPADSERAVSMGLGMMMGGGFGGLLMPLGPMNVAHPVPPVRARRRGAAAAPPPPAPAVPRPVWPHVLAPQNWTASDWSPNDCVSSGLELAGGQVPELTNPEQRCAVARWASEDLWMRSKMVRSYFPAEEHQPWNTLAHWVLALPFRMTPYDACLPPAPPESASTGGE